MECHHKGNRSTIPAGRKQKLAHSEKILGIPHIFFLLRAVRKAAGHAGGPRRSALPPAWPAEKKAPCRRSLQKITAYHTEITGKTSIVPSAVPGPRASRRAESSGDAPPIPRALPRRAQLPPSASFLRQSLPGRTPRFCARRIFSAAVIPGHAILRRRDTGKKFLPSHGYAEVLLICPTVLTERREFRILKQRTVTL